MPRHTSHSHRSPVLFFLALLSVCALAAPSYSGEAEIVRGRRVTACVVLSRDVHAIEKEAAEDLRRTVQQATGAQMEWFESQAPPRGLVPIRIGASAIPEKERPAEVAGLPYDGAVVRATADAIDIIGPTPAGTANGVATVLLEDLGARMYYPDALFVVVPKTSSIKIRSRTVRPAFEYRVWGPKAGMGQDTAGYCRRNRLTNREMPIPYCGFGHNLSNIIPAAKYGQEHPEYFAFRDGARRARGKHVGDTPQPCFTNPDVLRLAIEAAREFFDRNPEKDMYSLGCNDNPFFCECEKCAAMDKPYREEPVGRQYSESYFEFVSRVADAIGQSHPGRTIGVYAYWAVELPPRHREKLPDNVVVATTLDVLQHYDPAYRDRDRELIREWSRRVKRLHGYVYYGLGWFTPRTSPTLVAEDLRFAARNGVRAITCEASPFWAWCGPMHYVATRLQWNVEEDVDRLLDEFYRDCFGSVAVHMRAYHDACERYWTRPRTGRWLEGLEVLSFEEAMADVSVLREAQRHLDEALQKAREGIERDRILWIKPGFDFSMAVAEAFEAKRAAGSSEEKLLRLIAAVRKVKAAHERIAGRPEYQTSYYMPGKRFDYKCWTWFREAIEPAAETHWKHIQVNASAGGPQAVWEGFKKKCGLADLMEKQKWTFEFEKGSP